MIKDQIYVCIFIYTSPHDQPTWWCDHHVDWSMCVSKKEKKSEEKGVYNKITLFGSYSGTLRAVGFSLGERRITNADVVRMMVEHWQAYLMFRAER